MQRRTGCYGAGPDMIADFKATWPGHGFPENLNVVIAEFDQGGNLVDLEGFDTDGNYLSTTEFDGPALLALVEDIQDHGYRAREVLDEEYRCPDTLDLFNWMEGNLHLPSTAWH